MNLTPAQQKALDWLSSDGAWRADLELMLAGTTISKRFKELVEWETVPVWEQGSGRIRYRLTPKGIAYKAERKS